MTYVKVSIPKANDGAGAPTIKDATVILICVDDVASEPARSHGDTVITGDITLKEGAKAIGIYATPSSINPIRETNGEADARSLLKGLEFDHPGDSDVIESFIEANLNKGFIALYKECDGSAAGRVRLVGSKCNPLALAPEYTNTNEATRNHLVFRQEQGDKFAIATYGGTMPALADDADYSEEEGS